MPSGDVHALSRRISDLERTLMRYQNMFVGVTVPGAGQTMTIQVLGIRQGSEDAVAAGQTGAFCGVYKENGNWMLSGGVVSSGDGNNVVVDDIDIGNVGSEPPDGRMVWLNVSFTANISDGWLLPSGRVTAANDNQGAVLPDNIAPTAATTSGRCIIPLGIWNDEKFTPYGCGNVLVAHCFGALTYSRI